jgi:hypothetical protein
MDDVVIDLTQEPMFPYRTPDEWFEIVRSFRTPPDTSASKHPIKAVLKDYMFRRKLEAGFATMEDAVAYSQHLCKEALRFMHYRNIVAAYELARFHLQQHDSVASPNNTAGSWTVGFWTFAIVHVVDE